MTGHGPLSPAEYEQLQTELTRTPSKAKVVGVCLLVAAVVVIGGVVVGGLQ
jgi:anthranilate/para-aminobenzoate synthase component II